MAPLAGGTISIDSPRTGELVLTEGDFTNGEAEIVFTDSGTLAGGIGFADGLAYQGKVLVLRNLSSAENVITGAIGIDLKPLFSQSLPNANSAWPGQHSFTIRLASDGRTFGVKGSVFGLGFYDDPSSDYVSVASSIVFDPAGARVNWTADCCCFGGTTHRGIKKCNALCDWTVGSFANGSTFTSSSSSYFGSNYGSIFGFINCKGVLDGLLALLDGWRFAPIGHEMHFQGSGSVFGSIYQIGCSENFYGTNFMRGLNDWQLASIGNDNEFVGGSSIFGRIECTNVNDIGGHGVAILNDWKIGPIGNGNRFAASGSIFGLITLCSNGTSSLNGWRLAGIGNGNEFAGGYSIFGCIKEVGGNCSSALNDWRIGYIGNDNRFLSSATTAVGIFGLVTETEFYGDDRILNDWKLEGIGNFNLFEGKSSSGGGGASAFGLVCTISYASVSALEDWYIGPIGIGNCFLAWGNSGSAGCAIGGIWTNQSSSQSGATVSILNRWTLAGFGSDNIFGAFKQGGAAAIFGLYARAGTRDGNENESPAIGNGWRIGPIGSGCAFFTASDDYVRHVRDHAGTIFAHFPKEGPGPGTLPPPGAYLPNHAGIFALYTNSTLCAKNGIFEKWTFDGFGSDVCLIATASSRANVFGGMFNCNPIGNNPSAESKVLNGWKFGPFGDRITLQSTAETAGIFGMASNCTLPIFFCCDWTFAGLGNRSIIEAHGQRSASVFGHSIMAADTNQGLITAFRGWTLGPIGEENRLIATTHTSDSKGYPSLASVFGLLTYAKLSGYSFFDRWTVAAIGRRNSFVATAQSNGDAFAGIFATAARAHF
ncbi:MAG: hypothetical protein LBT98_00415, partial [Puniceicoccales bacterium]|nr:hypothetical protein [Puniceicoccales bacterium]